MSQPGKLTVKTAKDLDIPIPHVPFDIHTVEVTAPAEIYPVISGWELVLSSLNCAMRQYVTNSVTGRIIGSKLQFWAGYASGVVSVLLLVFLAWKIGVF